VLRSQVGIDVDALPEAGAAHAALLSSARQAKERLSRVDTFPVQLPIRFFGTRVPAVRLVRDQLEALFRRQLEAAEALIWQQLRIARLTHLRGSSTQDIYRLEPADLARDVQFVLLAGGMSRMPLIRRRMRELFPAAQVFDQPDGIEPDEAIVAGLADTVGHDRLSLHRPALDFRLEWHDGQPRQHLLYAAYTPLYSAHQVGSGQFSLGYTVHLNRRGFPQWGSGQLCAVSPTGQPVRLTTNSGAVDRVEIRFGSHQMSFKLYTDGRILLTDGSSFEHQLRLDGWRPVVGRDTGPEPDEAPEPAVPYPFNRED
jgi:Hsp70 protein